MDAPETPKSGPYNLRRSRTAAERRREQGEAAGEHDGGQQAAAIKADVEALRAKVDALQQFRDNLQGQNGISVNGSTISFDPRSLKNQNDTGRLVLTIFWNGGLATVDISGRLVG